MEIDFYGDLTCPWTHLGWRRLRSALQARPAAVAHVHWRPYQLNPDIPVTGLDRGDYLLRKFGNSERVRDVLNAVDAAMRTDGLHVNLHRIRIMSNTYLGHRLMCLAEPLGRTDALLQEIFVAYFVAGRDIGDPVVLREVAQLARLPASAVETELAAHDPHPGVSYSEQAARQLGVRAVPYILFDGHYSIAGAHDTVAFQPLVDLCTVEGPIPDPVRAN